MSEQRFDPPFPASSTASPLRPNNGTSQQVAEVAGVAKREAQHVAGEASDAARATLNEAKAQIDSLVGQTRSELRTQAEDRTAQAANGLHRMADELRALSEGRPQDAAQLSHYLRDAEQRVSSFASRLDERGPDGLMHDVTGFARRRPGTFLLCAAGVGFLAGRLAHTGVAVAHDQEADSPQQLPMYPSSPMADRSSMAREDVFAGGVPGPSGGGRDVRADRPLNELPR
jgi:ElaB/YqjD/DUF883 family membrane-anchored ribosome-binding protein